MCQEIVREVPSEMENDYRGKILMWAHLNGIELKSQEYIAQKYWAEVEGYDL